MRLVKVATCNLNQWAMEFDFNTRQIKHSISKAKQSGAIIRLGPELEITGYGCEDHFLELDTVNHSWECLKEILLGDWTDDIVCSIGMPIIKGSERYNCQVLCLNRKIIMIRRKMWLANDGNYRELRWFTAWKQRDELVDFQLPIEISEALGQNSVPFGYGFVKAIAAEVCEEFFTPIPPHSELALNGVEVFMNASGSHHQLRKLDVRLRAFIGATHTRGGVYMYSNHQGCDGGRLYYDGCASVVVNGDVVAQGSQFSLKDVEVVVAQIDLDVVSSLRGSVSSFQEQASCKTKVPSVEVPYSLCQHFNLKTRLSIPLKIKYHSPEEEIAFGPGCWLWDYLRRSGASGFLLPLSGGADSSSVAAIVGCMCQLVVKGEFECSVKCCSILDCLFRNKQVPQVTSDLASVEYKLSDLTRSWAKVLADEIGSWHLDVSIDAVLDGGSNVENLSLQNIQARIRMVLAFMLASLLPWVHSKPGFYLVLGSSNVDKGLRGYLTKYDCSSADINPIGSINIEAAPPTAELEPIGSDYSQLDEVDMGMTYEELSVYGRLRKIFLCGPVSMFQNLCYRWGARLTPSQVAEKVKHFFKYYSINRHKMTVLTPSYHAESYSPEDNRFDLRQFLYDARWPYQFRKIDELVSELNVKDVVQEPGEFETVAAASSEVVGGMGVAAQSDVYQVLNIKHFFILRAIAAEVCEEFFTPIPPHSELALNGVEVFMNASGSHHQLRKLDVRLRAFIGATHTRGGVYMYSNHQGCDGGRLYYDGCASVVVNGDVVAQGSQFSLKDVEVVVAQIDLDVVSSLRGSVSSFQEQASCKTKVPSVEVPYSLCQHFNLKTRLSIPLKIKYHSPEEEIAFGPGCWLWDYLRRSGASGFLLPLSGGADSSSVAAIVGCMCQLVVKGEFECSVKCCSILDCLFRNKQVPQVTSDLASVEYKLSDLTRSWAKVLADEIGSWHLDVSIDAVLDGGSNVENLSLQNIQARIRMVLAFMLASLLPWVHSKPGFYLVLGSSNVDKGLRGYLTKYDCSSADINPIGSINIEAAPPTAELEPIGSDYSQLDEVDMGMTYEELSVYGRLRKIFLCGPVSMFQNLCYRWGARLTPSQVAEKVKHFFKYYSINRHKMTVLTPSYHAESYSPEDNRFDLRQFLYDARWPYQFRKIDELVSELNVKDVVQEPGEFETVAAASSEVVGGMGVAAQVQAIPMLDSN
ncbi:hypothetical protein TanjilG_32048 [Lupinus angustifolius]|uniref:Glutamine-dependent NAD(+) synthetase n=1 Tax=Lupinus angustifolius TaxID=3871 RepID=A0A4P1RFN7_LUPAN|nr:hypothetical protein TanjilG_32048 [Lupinus angustifolius]